MMSGALSARDVWTSPEHRKSADTCKLHLAISFNNKVGRDLLSACNNCWAEKTKLQGAN